MSDFEKWWGEAAGKLLRYRCTMDEHLIAEAAYLAGQGASEQRNHGGGCTLAGPGRGDCEHFVGLPGVSIPGQHDGPDDTVDCYGKPNGWCWSCWKSHRLAAAEQRGKEVEARLEEIDRPVRLSEWQELQAKCAELERERDDLKKQVDWVRDLTSQRGVDAPLYPTASPLEDWLKERDELDGVVADQAMTIALLKAQAGEPPACAKCHGQTGGEVDICEGPHVVDRKWVDCDRCNGEGVEPSTPAAEPVTTRAPEGISREHLIALAKKCRLLGDYTTREIVDVVTGYARVVLNDPAVQEAFMRANTHPAAERRVPDGYALVPIEPTDEMIKAGMCHALTVDTYKAMLAAAPKETQ